nr:unnamed protein product [Callosobruchus chinensis]
MRVESHSKYKYFLEFIDDYSRYCVVFFLRNKNEVVQKTREYITLVENQKSRKIKYLQSDNGTEYTCKEMDNLLKVHGISRRLTCPYTPEQNGISERKNRTLLDTARCLLMQSGLPPTFWAEAINTANYLRNRCPSKSLNGLTPYEMWTGKTPDISHLRDFGCKVFCLNQDQNKGKLDARCKEGIFIGYSEGTKGYRVWIPRENKFLVTRNVKFSEDKEIMEKEWTDFAPDEETEEKETETPTISIQLTPTMEDKNPDPEAVTSGHEELEVEHEQPKRTRGRARIVRTGARGRPRKVYRTTQGSSTAFCEEAFLTEVPMQEAITGRDADEWQSAMADEVACILKNNTWELTERPSNQHVVGSRIVLRNKYRPDGIVERRKARLVAQGFSQKPGMHFNETFAPVARLSSIRLVTALAAHENMDIQQLDVTCAYLNGQLNETIYMETPPYLSESLETICGSSKYDEAVKKKALETLKQVETGDKVCLLKKSLYGLKQAGRSWYQKLSKTLKDCGAIATKADPCVFTKGEGEDVVIIVTYVDDLLIASRNKGAISSLKSKLSKKFEVKDLGPVNHCFGMEFSRKGNVISVTQRAYILEVLDRFNMTEANPVSTPLDPNTKLRRPTDNPSNEEARLPYRELVGALTYLSLGTRPDISFSVSYLGQFNNCYAKEHWTAAKRVLRYLKGTIDYSIVYKHDELSLRGFVDADWANCPDDRHSFTGFSFVLSSGPITWESKKQATVALSTMEAEYMGATEAAKEAIYLKKFVTELGFERLADITLYSDSMSAIKLAENPRFHSRSKHIDVRYHFVREALEGNKFKLLFTPTSEMAADILTKGLPRPKHNKNMVEFNASKTQYCTLSNKRCPSEHSVLMNNQALPRSHSFKLLGFSITENMIWHEQYEHVSSIATAAGKKLGYLFRAKKYFSPSNLPTL